jgi:DNA repair protein RecN (Recombination protein N)
MLLQLHLHNFALAEQLQVDLQPGLTVVTGETGAGKSIVLQALAICLGDRADSSSVRIGADKADVSALFDIGASPAAATWLAERARKTKCCCAVWLAVKGGLRHGLTACQAM